MLAVGDSLGSISAAEANNSPPTITTIAAKEPRLTE